MSQTQPPVVRHNAQTISDQTYLLKEKLWFDSFAQNLPFIRGGHQLKELRGTRSGPCIVLGAGPSVEKFEHLHVLKSHKDNLNVEGRIIAADRMLKPLYEASGILASHAVTVDGSPLIADFYEGANFASDPILPVNVHPNVLKSIDRSSRIYWFVPQLEDNFDSIPRSVTRALIFMSGHDMAGQAYGNAGAFAHSLAEYLGFNPIILVGIDFSYGPAPIQPMQTAYWKGFLARRGGNIQETLKHDYKWVTNPFGHKVLTDAVWEGYRDVFMKGLLEKSKTGLRTINCSEYTTAFSPLSSPSAPANGVMCMKLEEALRSI